MTESSFQEYETHFTVMNYGKDITNIRCEPWIEMFNEDLKAKGLTFEQCQTKIDKVINDVFIAFQARYAE